MERTIVKCTWGHSASLFTNKGPCAIGNSDIGPIPVVINANRSEKEIPTANSPSCLQNIALTKHAGDENSLLKVFLINARSVCNKSHEIADFIVEEDIDILLITETWLSKATESNRVVLGNLVPAGYSIHHIPRAGRRGGGVGLVFKSSLDIKKQDTASYTSFEHVEALLRAGNDCFRLSVIYRPPLGTKSSKPTSVFLEEFEDYVDSHTTTSGKLVLCGDFNFKYEDDKNQDTLKFKDLAYF